jgi:ribosomal protein S13
LHGQYKRGSSPAGTICKRLQIKKHLRASHLEEDCVKKVTLGGHLERAAP